MNPDKTANQNSGISQVLVAGAGTMGGQIATVIAQQGVRTILYDSDSAQLEKIVTTWPDLTCLSVSGSLSPAVRDSDLVIECIPEKLDLKRRFFSEIHGLCRPDAILASNTSDILPSRIARAIPNAPRFCAYHFHAPQYGANIVDIMPHPGTDKDIPPRLEAFTRRINLIPIVLKKEHPAYIYNAILNSILDTSVKLVMTGVADYRDIDRAWMGNTGMGIGPFGMLDLIGLDTALAVTKVRARKNPLLFFGAGFFKRMIKQGQLGMKSGQGFYSYPDPEYAQPGFLK